MKKHLLLTIFVLLLSATLSTGYAGADVPATRVIVSDDFEQGISQRITHDPSGRVTGYAFDGTAPRLRAMLAGLDPSGKAGISIQDGPAASGTKCIRLQDTPSVQPDFMPTLNWWFNGTNRPMQGTLRIAFDLLVPVTEGAEFKLSTRDYSESRAERRRGASGVAKLPR